MPSSTALLEFTVYWVGYITLDHASELAKGRTNKVIQLSLYCYTKIICRQLHLVKLAGELGFEPKLTESKSVVLPLHYSPTDDWSELQDSNLRPSAPKADALPDCAKLGKKLVPPR